MVSVGENLPHHDDAGVTMNDLVRVLAPLLEHILSWLPPADVCLFGRTAGVAKAAAHSEHSWRERLMRTFPDLPDTTSSSKPMKYFAGLAYLRHGLACPCALGCGGSLFVDGARRCECVAARVPNLPLVLGSLVGERSGTSALSSGGFNAFIAMLRRTFRLNHVELASLEDDALAQMDVFILCTTEGPALGPVELANLRAWVEKGGALIVSAFSNWSAYGHYAATTVGWLGLQTVRRARFEGHTEWDLIALVDSDPRAVSSLLKGPFGHTWHFKNCGESRFQLSQDAFRFGAVNLTTRNCDVGTLVFYPPRSVSHEGVTGKGRVLVCSNFHWLADADHWNGGHFAFRRRDSGELRSNEALRPNQALVLNFLAGAIAARADRGEEKVTGR
eukprot:TRINITY_DN38260_c0_g1_i1.p1 TRINITY_DN38260_c0_g1~~TRINITY_DN38260_c0_g1_i1.p1  ORF type:complete len:402 (-),score=21.12 TRINITY_DN38260_c0_g1_i1:137-1303(-)